MFSNAVGYLQFKSKLHLTTYLGIYIIFLFLYYGLKFLMSPIGGKPQTLWSFCLFKIGALQHLKINYLSQRDFKYRERKRPLFGG